MEPTITLDEIIATQTQLRGYVYETPVWRWQADDLQAIVGSSTEVVLKLELLQQTGTFKARGALSVMLGLDDDARTRGVTTVSAGNHAIAVAYAAKLLGCSAKVVMPKSANAARVKRCRGYGAEVELVDDVGQAFARVEAIQHDEGRTFVHPFEGPRTALGTGTLGLEFINQVPDLDVVIIPVGGGGLIGGMAAAVKFVKPSCQVIGVEPEGAATMTLSLAAGSPQPIDKVRTIADSLGPPYALPYSFELGRRYVDEVVVIDDDEMRRGMALLFQSMKLAVEPAGAASTAALCGPLRRQLRGKRVGLLVCGTNIDLDTFYREASVGADLLPDWLDG